MKLNKKQQKEFDSLLKEMDEADSMVFTLGKKEGDNLVVRTALVGELPILQALIHTTDDRLQESFAEFVSNNPKLKEVAYAFKQFMEEQSKESIEGYR